MNKGQRIGVAIGGGVIAVGAAVGVGAVTANLASSTGHSETASSSYSQAPGRGYPNRGQQLDTTTMATQLASKLGVDAAKMKSALDNAFKANQPSGSPSGGFNGTPGAAPSGGPDGQDDANDTRLTERLTAISKSIATELNLDPATVLTALEEVMPTGGRPTAQPTK